VDSLWVSNTLLPSVITAAVLLLILWPTRQSGTRLLQRWGVAEPAGAQIAEAIRYLRQRRILYVLLFLVLPPVYALLWPSARDGGGPGTIIVPLLAAMLVAELIATLRPVSGVRVASLDRRGWRDLVPAWAIAVAAVLTVWAVLLVVLGLVAQPWARRYAEAIPPDGKVSGDNWSAEVDPAIRERLLDPDGWYTLAGIAACLAVVGVLVFLAVRRPAVTDAAVDGALRTRTARVAVAIGFLWLAGLVNDAQSRLEFLEGTGRGTVPLPEPPGWLSGNLHQTVEIGGFVVVIGAVLCWMWLAMPSRKSLARAAR
jgi:hypothetical protein